MAPRTRKLTEPLATITFLFGAFLTALMVLAIANTLVGRGGSLTGYGHTAVCATDSNIGIGGDPPAPIPEFATRPGASLNDNSNLSACVMHPALGQRLLSTLTGAPSILLFAGILLVVWRIIRSAGRGGPFTPHIAAMLRGLGWLIIVGTMVVAAIQEAASLLLLNTMLAHHVASLAGALGYAASSAIWALLPERILIGGALLTFARIMRLGSAMEDEIKATV
jgi:hypothetical protein